MKCFWIAVLVALCSFFSPVQAQGLNENNVQEYYDFFERSNADFQEGFDDLNQWLLFLDESLADDYRKTSLFYEGCAVGPVHPVIINKQNLLQIYKEIGISNYKIFEVNVRSIDMNDDKSSAFVDYTLDIVDDNSEFEFSMLMNCKARHVWDSERQRSVLKSEICEENMLMGYDDRKCALRSF